MLNGVYSQFQYDLQNGAPQLFDSRRTEMSEARSEASDFRSCGQSRDTDCVLCTRTLGGKKMRRTAIALIVAFLLIPTTSPGQPARGSVCVAPVVVPLPPPRPDMFCRSGKFSLKIDNLKVVSWPDKESVRFAGLELDDRHRVVVYCDSNPQQSFTFRFNEYKTTELCLFFNDRYGTIQLWDTTRSPWCKCK